MQNKWSAVLNAGSGSHARFLLWLQISIITLHPDNYQEWTMPGRVSKPYKPRLSMFEIEALSKEHKDRPIIQTNRQGNMILERWLRGLRYRDAYQVAEKILGDAIDEAVFQACWA